MVPVVILASVGGLNQYDTTWVRRSTNISGTNVCHGSSDGDIQTPKRSVIVASSAKPGERNTIQARQTKMKVNIFPVSEYRGERPGWSRSRKPCQARHST